MHTPPKHSQTLKLQPSAFDSPPANVRTLIKQSPDDSLDCYRRAPRKGERPQYLQDLHEEAAQSCARQLFQPGMQMVDTMMGSCDDDASTNSTSSTPKPFDIDMAQEGSITCAYPSSDAQSTHKSQAKIKKSSTQVQGKKLSSMSVMANMVPQIKSLR